MPQIDGDCNEWPLIAGRLHGSCPQWHQARPRRDRGGNVRNPKGGTAAGVAVFPAFWSEAIDPARGKVLTYAIHGGKAGIVLGALGAACLAGGAWVAHWMLSDGGLTIGRYPAQARWLGSILAARADVPVMRGFGGGREEADEAELSEIGK